MHKTGNRAYIYQIDLSSQGADDVRIIASSYIDNCSKVLDVGCACGDFGYYISNRKQCDVYGMEYNAESIKTAFDKQVYKEIHQMDLNTFETDTFKKYCNYSGVFFQQEKNFAINLRGYILHISS